MLGISVYDVQLLSAVFTLSLAANFLLTSANGLREQKSKANWKAVINLAFFAVVIATGGYVTLFYPAVSLEVPWLPSWLIVLSGALFGALILNLRRAAGLGILLVVSVFLAYGLFGHFLSGDIQSRQTTPTELIVYLMIDPNGVLGTALKVAVTIVIPYLLFGQLLVTCGAANFF